MIFITLENIKKEGGTNFPFLGITKVLIHMIRRKKEIIRILQTYITQPD